MATSGKTRTCFFELIYNVPYHKLSSTYNIVFEHFFQLMYILSHNQLSFTYSKYFFILIDNFLYQGLSISYIDNNCNRTTIHLTMNYLIHTLYILLGYL
jgi:hypothetical protein